MTPRVIAPGGTIGVLGGGQLGRMFAMAARRLGYRVHTLAPEHDTPTGQIADVEVVASYDDIDRIRDFARQVDVVTFEFENVSAAAAAAAEDMVVVRPNGRSLHVAQHRVREKMFLHRLGVPVAPFGVVSSDASLADAARTVGCPSVLKTAAFGYDGKGQVMIERESDLVGAWHRLGAVEAVLESFVDLEREISVVAARSVGGAIESIVPIDNLHRHHILDVSVAPADLPAALTAQAAEIARTILEALDYVGVLCVEFFLTRAGHLLVNELAPRPHNSGHLTIEACRTSQFEQQVRAVCGYELGATELLRPAAMVNLLGDVWSAGEPDWAAALAMGDIKLHLYGKATPRPGRKMGHMTALAPTAEQARQRVLAARQALLRG